MEYRGFIDWLNGQLQERDWTYSKLSKRMGVVPSTVSMVLSGKTSPTWEFCAGVAQALGQPPEDVFRRAGLLPPVPDPEGARALYDLARNLDQDKLKQLKEFGEYLYTKQSKK